MADEPITMGLGLQERNTPVPARKGGGQAEGSREPRAPPCQGGCGAPDLPHPSSGLPSSPPHPSLEHRVPCQGLGEAQPRCRMCGGRYGVGRRKAGGRTKTQSERQEEREACGVSPSRILPSTLMRSKDEQVLQRKGKETRSEGFAQLLPSCLTPVWPLSSRTPTCGSTQPGKRPLCVRQALCKHWDQGSRWSAVLIAGDRGFPRMWHVQGSDQGGLRRTETIGHFSWG